MNREKLGYQKLKFKILVNPQIDYGSSIIHEIEPQKWYLQIG